MVKLGEVCEFITDGDWIESKSQSNDGIRLIQTGNVGIGKYIDKEGKEKYISEDTFSELKCTEIYERDVLISRLPAPVGRACIIPKMPYRMITAVDCTIIRFLTNKILGRYFVYFTQSQNYQNQIDRHIAGSTRVRISRKNLESIMVSLPPLDVQKHIADTLDKTQEIIDGHKKQLEELDNLIKATFYGMFGDPVVDEKGWGAVELGKVAKLIGGYAFKSEDYVENGVRLVQIANVHKDILSWEVANYLPKEYLGKYRNYNLSSGDIVLAMTRPIIKSLDAVKIAVVQESDKPCLLNQRVGKFDIRTDVINPAFLLEFCRSQSFKNAVELFSSNSLQPNVSSKQIESISCYLPPLDLQNKFAEIVTNIEEQKSLVKQSIAEAQNLFNSLMSEYFD